MIKNTTKLKAIGDLDGCTISSVATVCQWLDRVEESVRGSNESRKISRKQRMRLVGLDVRHGMTWANGTYCEDFGLCRAKRRKTCLDTSSAALNYHN